MPALKSIGVEEDVENEIDENWMYQYIENNPSPDFYRFKSVSSAPIDFVFIKKNMAEYLINFNIYQYFVFVLAMLIMNFHHL